MLITLCKKDWKERRGIVYIALTLIVVYTAAFLVHRRSYETANLITTVMILVFLPFLAVTLGAGSFQSELKDGAWAYLFSRPVSRWKIWSGKLISQFLLLLFFAGIFFAVGSLLPGFDQMCSDYFLPPLFQSKMTLSFSGIVLALNLFALSFALSTFHDNPLIPVFLALLMLPILGYTAWGGMALLKLIFPYIVSPTGLVFLIPLAVMGASYLSFRRADFTQRDKIVKTFLLRMTFLLAAALAFGLALTTGLDRLNNPKPRINQIGFSGDLTYIATDTDIMCCDLANKKARRLAEFQLFNPRFYIGAGKMAFISSKNKRGEGEALWLSDPHGLGPEKISSTDTDSEEGATAFIRSFVFSSDGERMGWLMFRKAKDQKKTTVFIVQCRGDGRDIRSYPLNIPDWPRLKLAGWTEGTGEMILCISEGKGCRIAAFDWEREYLRFLAGDIIQFQPYAPEGRAEGLTFVREEESGERSLVLMTFDDMKEKNILTADWVNGWLTWDSRGRRCFFTRDLGRNGQMIYIYDRIEESIESLDLDRYDYNISWVTGDRALLYRNMASDGLVLKNLESGEEKRIALPFMPRRNFWVHGLNNYVLLETYPEYDLWVLDLIRQEWRRIY